MRAIHAHSSRCHSCIYIVAVCGIYHGAVGSHSIHIHDNAHEMYMIICIIIYIYMMIIYIHIDDNIHDMTLSQRAAPEWPRAAPELCQVAKMCNSRQLKSLRYNSSAAARSF